jgi:hypothetical protein
VLLVSVCSLAPQRVRRVVGERLNVNADRNILHQNTEQIRPFYGEAMRYTGIPPQRRMNQALDTHPVVRYSLRLCLVHSSLCGVEVTLDMTGLFPYDTLAVL